MLDLIDFYREVKREAVENGFVSANNIDESMRENDVLIKDFWLRANEAIADGHDAAAFKDLPYETANAVFFNSSEK